MKPKVAVLLRGQPRLCSEAAILFNRITRDRLWEHYDFKIFIAVWPSRSQAMTALSEQSELRKYSREFSQESVPLDEVRNLISEWRPDRYEILRERDLFNLTEKIMSHRYTNVKFNEWFTEHYKTKDKDSAFMIHNFFNNKLLSSIIAKDTVSAIDKFSVTHKLDTIRLNYILGQMYGAGKSYDVLKRYMEEHDWTPDLVWSSRLDHMALFSEHQLRDILDHLNFRVAGSNTQKPHVPILVEKLGIRFNRIWMSDYNFWMKFEDAENILGNIHDNILELFTADIEHLLTAIGSGPLLQHALWASLFRNNVIDEVHPVNRPKYSTVLRPIANLHDKISDIIAVPFNDIDNLETKLKAFYEDIKSMYVYPNPTEPVPSELISSAYEHLRTN